MSVSQRVPAVSRTRHYDRVPVSLSIGDTVVGHAKDSLNAWRAGHAGGHATAPTIEPFFPVAYPDCNPPGSREIFRPGG